MKHSSRLPLLALLSVIALSGALLFSRIPGGTIPTGRARLAFLLTFALLLVPALWVWLGALGSSELVDSDERKPPAGEP